MNKYQEIIEKYLSGTLTEIESKAFENRLETQQDLREAYELELASRRVVQIAGRKNLKSRLDQFEEKQEAKIIHPFINRKKFLLIASLFVGFTLAYWLIQFTGGKTETDYFAVYFKPYRSLPTERGKENVDKNVWDAARDLYWHGKYGQAVLALKSSISSKQAPEYLMQFYLGVSLLAQENPEPLAGIEALKKVMLSHNHYQQQAKWYMALAYLKLDDKEQAVKLLEELDQLNDFKRKEVKVILNALTNK